MTPTEKEKADQMFLTIPLLARGIDATGEVFETAARTVTLNPHGAQIQIPRLLRSGQAVRLVNLIGRHEGDFRVVGTASAPTEKAWIHNVECLHDGENIWRIHFPPPAAGVPADAKALLECRMCNRIALVVISTGELEVLRTAGVVAKSCPGCNAVTPWRYADISAVEPGAAGEGWMSAVAGLARRRRHRRVYLQRPLSVRDLAGETEVTRTENESRGGFCFTSEKVYQSGQEIAVLPLGNADGREMEIPARIIWQQNLEGINRKVYGMDCEPRTNP